MINWLKFSAIACAVALFGSCERHSPEALDRLPGHHESHGEGEHEADEAGHQAAPHAAEPAPAAAAPRADTTPPKYFN